MEKVSGEVGCLFLGDFLTQLDKTLSNMVSPHNESSFEQKVEMTS